MRLSLILLTVLFTFHNAVADLKRTVELAIARGGGIVYVKTGESFSTTITVPVGVQLILQGEGQDAPANITFTGAGHAFDVQSRSIIVKDLFIEVTSMSSTSDVFHFDYQGGDQTLISIFMQNVRIHAQPSLNGGVRPRAGIYMKRPILSNFQRVQVDSCRYGLLVDPVGNDGGTTLNIDNSWFIDNIYGAQIVGSTSGTIRAGAFERSDSIGLILKKSFSWSINGVDFENNKVQDALIDSSGGIHFAGNSFRSQTTLPNVQVQGVGWTSRIGFYENRFAVSSPLALNLSIKDASRVVLMNNHFSSGAWYKLDPSVSNFLIMNDDTLKTDNILKSQYLAIDAGQKMYLDGFGGSNYLINQYGRIEMWANGSKDVEFYGNKAVLTNSDIYLWTSLYGTVMGMFQGGYIEGLEMNGANEPAAPSANRGRLYFRDNGSGKTQLVVRFPTGAVQVIATEP